jgi:hypothetical protein
MRGFTVRNDINSEYFKNIFNNRRLPKVVKNVHFNGTFYICSLPVVKDSWLFKTPPV